MDANRRVISHKPFSTLCLYPLTVLSLVVLIGCSSKPVEEVQVGDATEIQNSSNVVAAPGDWPWWHGPTGNNHAIGPLPPTEWSETKNVIWKASVPGLGHASPIVVGEQVFLATADDDAETMSLLSFDRASGIEQWSCELHSGGFMNMHQKNSHASATPASDGEKVYTVFMVQKGIWASAVNLEGEIVWQTMVGGFKSRHGYGSSPLIYKSLVIVAGDNDGGSFLAAVYRDSGKIAWRVSRAKGSSFGTPILMTVEGKDQIVLSGHELVCGYDPTTGEELWRTEGPAKTVGNTVTVSDAMIFASGGYPDKQTFAIDLTDGEPKQVWKNRYKSYVPSMLFVGKNLFAVSDDGVGRLFDGASGEMLSQKRLGGDYSASPVLCGEYVFLPDESGRFLVISCRDDEIEIVAKNELDSSGGMATPAIVNGQIFIRTEDDLYCIGTQE